MSATVFYAGAAELATLTMTFEVSGTPTDPTTVALLVTDPLSAPTAHTYNPGDITKVSTGVYTINIPSPTAGLWTYQWTGTGACSDVQDGTWWVASSPATMYCSAEQLKSRLGIEDNSDDLEITMAVQTAPRLVDRFCGRFFYQTGIESRTYRPESIYEQPIDDLVTISQLATDWDGDGVYETVWTGPGVDYALEVYRYRYNPTATGEPRPYTLIRALGALGGRYFPFVWPWTHQDRVKVTGTFGWPAIPIAVQHATLILAADLFKIKDAPFGVAGFSEYGAVRVGTNSEVYSMLQPYISGRNKVGV